MEDVLGWRIEVISSGFYRIYCHSWLALSQCIGICWELWTRLFTSRTRSRTVTHQFPEQSERLGEWKWWTRQLFPWTTAREWRTVPFLNFGIVYDWLGSRDRQCGLGFIKSCTCKTHQRQHSDELNSFCECDRRHAKWLDTASQNSLECLLSQRNHCSLEDAETCFPDRNPEKNEPRPFSYSCSRYTQCDIVRLWE